MELRSAVSAAALLCSFALRVSAAELVPVHVTLRSSSGKPVPEASIAFVAPDRPVSRPSAVQVTTNGEAIVHVTPAQYQVFAAARGHALAIRTFDVTAASRLTIDLPASQPLHGIVRDERGQPIAGARVRHMRAVGPQPFATTPELVRLALESDWTTYTDAEGRWTLTAGSDAPVPVLIEAPGFAPMHELRAPSATVTTLRSGASVRVEFDRADPDRLVALVPRDETASEGWEPLAWARAIDAATVTWDAMPAGAYDVVVRYGDPARFARPVTLQTIRIAAGEEQELRLQLPAATPASAKKTILFLPQSKRADLVSLQARIATLHGADEVPYALEAASGGMLLYLKAEASPSEIFVTTPGAVITAVNSGQGTIESPFATATSPRADAVVKLVVPDTSVALEQWIDVTFDTCNSGGKRTVQIAPGSDGTLALPYPTVCRSLILRSAPFAPAILGVTLTAGQHRDLGTIALAHAATARVHVRRNPGGAPVSGAIVHARVDEVVIAEATTNDEGVATLTGLPSGREHVLTAREPKTGRSGSATATVTAGEELVVDPLAIADAARLVIAPRLPAPFRERFLDAAIESVSIHREGREAARKTASLRDEEAAFDDLDAGEWKILALVRAGGSLQPIQVRTVELLPGDTRRLEVEVAPRVYSGRLVTDGKGLAAQIGIAEPPSPRAMTRFAQSDADGAFMVMLPDEGIYRVTVTPREQTSQLDLGEIRFGDPLQPVLLELPTATLTIRVLRRDAPVAGASVTAVLRRGTAYGDVAEIVRKATTNADGAVRLPYMTRGTWSIEASIDKQRARATANVPGSPPVDLRLTEARQIGGVVRGPGAAGATVTCLFARADGIPQIASTDSAADGSYAIELAEPLPARLQCGVATASGRIATFTATPAQTADVTLPSDGGAVRIADWGERVNRNRFWLVSSAGQLYDLSWISSKLRTGWAPLAIAGIAPGSWSIVQVSAAADWTALVTGNARRLPVVARFSVGPREATEVRLHHEHVSE